MEAMKTHWELRQELVEKCAAEDGFRDQLVDDPRGAIKDALGIELPDTFSVEVHQESATTAHIVLPPMATLDVDDLEVVAGGHREENLYGDRVPHPHGERYGHFN